MMQTCDLCPQILDSEDFDGYRRDRVLMQAEPKLYVPFVVLTPHNIKQGKSVPTYSRFFGYGSTLMTIDQYTPGKERLQMIPIPENGVRMGRRHIKPWPKKAI